MFHVKPPAKASSQLEASKERMTTTCCKEEKSTVGAKIA